MAESEPSPSDRWVVFFIAALALGILAVDLVSALVPGIDGALATLPLVVLVLVVGTAWIPAGSLRRRGC